MQERTRNLSIPSPDVPIARERIRAMEVLLSLLVVVVPLWVLLLPTGPVEVLVDIGLLVVLVSPPLLAVVALVGVVDDGISIGAVVVAVLALTTLYVASVSVYALVASSEGGVYGGHLFTLGTGIVLAVGVLARTVVVFTLRRLDISV